MENKYIDNWNENADSWNTLIDNAGIPSRKITNPAILRTILEWNDGDVLDCGCGEGWLVRMLKQKGIHAEGFDGSSQLILLANNKSEGRFYAMGYEEFTTGRDSLNSRFDQLVFNYSIFQEDIQSLLLACHKYVHKGGSCIIQTVHPFFLLDKGNYSSAWQHDIWAGLDGSFEGTLPWYARTLGDWFQEFSESKWSVRDIKETKTNSGLPLSIIFVLYND